MCVDICVDIYVWVDAPVFNNRLSGSHHRLPTPCSHLPKPCSYLAEAGRRWPVVTPECALEARKDILGVWEGLELCSWGPGVELCGITSKK